ncbi:MAG: hypothetical protein ACI89L_001167 [Phycisphaerales bacterium]|jgi:hypothetical protein
MKTNEGGIDRALRVIIGAGLLVAAFVWLGVMDAAPLGIAAAVVGAVFVLTSFCGYCPAYALVGIKTCPTKG